MGTFKKLKQARRRARFVGFMFVVIGGLMTAIGVVSLFNPEATMSCNGVVTNSASCKVQFALTNMSFVVLGIGCLVIPKAWINRIIVWQASMPTFFGGGRS